MKTQAMIRGAPGRREAGSVLILSMIVLVMLTLIGVTGTQTTLLEEKMAGNMQDKNLAFEAAEAALRDGEQFLRAGGAGLAFDGTAQGLYDVTLAPSPPWNDPDTWDAGIQTLLYKDGVGGFDPTFGGRVAIAPRFMIEQLLPQPSPCGSLAADTPPEQINLFRITARGVGGSTGAVVVLESVLHECP